MLLNPLDPLGGIEDEAQAIAEGDFNSHNVSAVGILYSKKGFG